MAELLKGAAVAAAITEDLKTRAAALREKGISPKLAIVRVGERDGDLSYERGAMKRCATVGIEVKNLVLPMEVTQAQLMEAIDGLNADDGIHGVLMLRPLPKTLDERAACAALLPAKDVDGITAGSLAKIYSGGGEGYPPCTAQSVMEILKFYGIDPAGKRVAVIGRSLVIGRPVSMLLMAANATVTICHTKTVDVQAITRQADIIVAASGQAESVTADYLSQGQTVIDVGISFSEAKQKLVGDVDFETVEPLAAAITPVPGGVGSVTTAVLCSHVLSAAERYTIQ